jgi:hypothetical protein
MKTLMLGTIGIIAIAAQPCSAGNLAKNLGFYDWGGQYVSSLGESVQQIVALGSRAARITLSPRYNFDYHQGTTCSAASSLQALVQQPDIQAALDNPNIDVFMITAYDFTTFGDCQTQRYLEPQFYTPENVQALVQEYSDLTLYLYQAYAHTYKRFVISNWESDNSIYCGQAYSYATTQSFRDYCDGAYPSLYYGNATPAESLKALKLWFQYRQQGIADGRVRAAQLGLRGMRVYFAPEFCITRALHDGGFQSVLYDVLPSVMFDYVSYSAYESINAAQPGDTLTADLNTIREVTGSRSIILGEIGFSQSAWGTAAISRTSEVLAAADSWGVSYVFVWNLYDSSVGDDYGAYGTDGTLTDLGAYYQGILSGTAGRRGAPISF